MPTTSAVNPEGWANVMEAHLAKGQDVLCMTFTSGLSTTYQSAVIAADELREKYPQRKIIVVDPLCAALGQGLLVWYACKKRNAGKERDTSQYQRRADRSEHINTVGSEKLYKGSSETVPRYIHKEDLTVIFLVFVENIYTYKA